MLAHIGVSLVRSNPVLVRTSRQHRAFAEVVLARRTTPR